MHWKNDLLFLSFDQTGNEGQSNATVEWVVARFTTKENFI